MSKSEEDSDRFRPTESHPIVELTKRTSKVPNGYVCPSCGHLAVDEDELIGKTCPKCLQEWLAHQHVNQMVPIKDLAKERDSALVPTIIIPDIVIVNETPSGDKTTKIIEEKKKTVTDSDDRIPGL